MQNRYKVTITENDIIQSFERNRIHWKRANISKIKLQPIILFHETWIMASLASEHMILTYNDAETYTEALDRYYQRPINYFQENS